MGMMQRMKRVDAEMQRKARVKLFRIENAQLLCRVFNRALMTNPGAMIFWVTQETLWLHLMPYQDLLTS